MRYKEGHPSETELGNLAMEILQIWKRCGRALGLDNQLLFLIESDEKELYECAYTMLLKWAQLHGGYATYSKLAEGLLSPMLQPARIDLVEKYCTEKDLQLSEETETGTPSETDTDDSLPKSIQEVSLNDQTAPDVTCSVSILPGKPYHTTYPRQRDVQEIEDLFKSIRVVDDVITVYLTGPPGSGKSQLARQFGFWYGQRLSNKNGCVVATLHAETAESLLESYRRLSCELGLSVSETVDDVRAKLEALTKCVKEFITSENVQWLFIVDNVEESAPMKKFWPSHGSGWGTGRVLVTTQDAVLAPTSSEYARTISLSRGMNEVDAVGLMCLIAELEQDDYATQVARMVDYYPLSLACAAVFIKEMRTDRPAANYGWKDYVSTFAQYFERIVYTEYTQNNRCYPRSMLSAAICAAKRMATQSEVLGAAFKFLSHCALQPVPLEVVADHVMRSCREVPDIIKGNIAKCQLLIYPRSGARGIEVVSMHQVMRAAFVHLRRKCQEQSVGTTARVEEGTAEKEERASLEFALESINLCYRRYKVSLDKDGISMRILLSPHLCACVDISRQKEWIDSETFMSGSVFLADSLVHVAGATDTQRVQILEQAREVQMRLGLRSLSACQMLSDLGYTYREAGKLDRVIPVLEEAFVIADTHQGVNGKPKDCEWLKQRSHILNILAWTYREMYELDLAAAYMEECVDVTKQAFGATHTEVVERLCNLGIIYADAWKNEHALRVLGEARDIVDSLSNQSGSAIRAQVLNYTAKVRLRWYLGLFYSEGNTQRAMEHLEQSKQLHEQALKIYERLHGKKHKFYTGTLVSYGTVLRHFGDLERAHEYCAFALDVYRTSGHMAWPRFATSLADVLLAKRQFQAAKDILRDALTAQTQESSSRASWTRALLAEVLVETGEKEKGEKMLEECLAEWDRQGVNPEHYWVVKARHFLENNTFKDCSK